MYYGFFYISQNLALLFLTLPFSVQMTIIINNLNRKVVYLALPCYHNMEMRDVVSKVLKHKEKKPVSLEMLYRLALTVLPTESKFKFALHT